MDLSQISVLQAEKKPGKSEFFSSLTGDLKISTKIQISFQAKGQK
jgi:hypothetical protein